MTPTSPDSRRTPTPKVLLGDACGFENRRQNEHPRDVSVPAVDAEREASVGGDTVAELRSRLLRMSLKLSEQERRHNSEISRLRKENGRLLRESTRLSREKADACSKASRYKHIARRLKGKLLAIQNSLKEIQTTSETNLEIAADKTKSLLERLFLSDMRRRDLEARFGTLARPSTNLKQKLNSPRQAAMNDLAIVQEGSDAKIHRMPAANAPPLLVIAPHHLDDRSFSPESDSDVKPCPPAVVGTRFQSKFTKSPAKRRHVSRITVPQFSSSKIEDRLEPLLKGNELKLLHKLSDLDDECSDT